MLLATSQQVSSASALVAWVMPTAPGVNDDVGERARSCYPHDRPNVTGIAKAARKIPITVNLQSHDKSDVGETRA